MWEHIQDYYLVKYEADDETQWSPNYERFEQICRDNGLHKSTGDYHSLKAAMHQTVKRLNSMQHLPPAIHKVLLAELDRYIERYKTDDCLSSMLALMWIMIENFIEKV